MSEVSQYDVILDAREERCPMPLLKLKLALAKMASGQVICVYATDQGSLADIPHYLTLIGLPLLEQGVSDGSYYFVIRKQEQNS